MRTPAQIAARTRAVSWAKTIASDPNVVYIDTETTGLNSDAEICEISIIDHAGLIVLDSFIKPKRTIPAEATAVHQITNEMVSDAPSFLDIYDHIYESLTGKVVCVWNQAYDQKIINQVAKMDTLPSFPYDGSWVCSMLGFSDFMGEPGKYSSFRWFKLPDACARMGIEFVETHRAKADTEASRKLVHAMAMWMGDAA